MVHLASGWPLAGAKCNHCSVVLQWANAMAAQGSGGAYEISQRMTAMIGWGGTADFKEDWAYDQAWPFTALSACITSMSIDTMFMQVTENLLVSCRLQRRMHSMRRWQPSCARPIRRHLAILSSECSRQLAVACGMQMSKSWSSSVLCTQTSIRKSRACRKAGLLYILPQPARS